METLQSVLERYKEELREYEDYFLSKRIDGYWIIRRNRGGIIETLLGTEIAEAEENLIKYVIEETEAKVWYETWNRKKVNNQV